MELAALYHNYLNLKFSRGLPLQETGHFEYGLCEDGTRELFLEGNEDEYFSGWIYELLPADPHYADAKGLTPMLSSHFRQLDVYDEQVLNYLMLTINSTTSIVPITIYNEMNDRMKHYCFFQLAQQAPLSVLSADQKAELRNFFFWFYLYAHPVNGDTLEAFSFHGPDLIHTKTGIRVQDYLKKVHEYYVHNYKAYTDRLKLSPLDIEACCELTLHLLAVVEGRSSGLTMPNVAGLEQALRLINSADELLSAYARSRSEVFSLMRDLLSCSSSTAYGEHIISMLLQNYVCYILYFEFEEILELVDYFRDDLTLGGIIVNRMFTETIFIQKILQQNRLDLRSYSNVTALFNEDTREMYQDHGS